MKFNPRAFLFFAILCQSLLYLGQAVSCKAGYYAENNLTCVACEDGKSSPDGALSIDECQPCADKGCKTCKGITTNACLICDLDYYLYNGECISSSNGSPGTSYTCVDQGCTECFGNNTGQCSSCDAGYYLENNQCVSCGKGKSSMQNSTNINACDTCDDYPNCQMCSGLGRAQCTSCLDGSAPINGTCENPDMECEDSNCFYCSGSGTGKCLGCRVPFSLINGTCQNCTSGGCLSCDDENCELCSGKGTGQCTRCQSYFTLVNGSCESSEIECEDSNCIQCSGPGTEQCLECRVPFSLINGTCLNCPSGDCLSCDDKNCELCSGKGTGQCLSCAANYYLSDNTCASCGDGQFSLAGSLNSTDCFDCEDSNCASCNGSGLGKCSTCKDGYYLTENNTCNTCEDENCLVCDGANIGRCTSCLVGFELISGTCKLPGEPIKTDTVVSASIRYDMTMTQFNKEGGKNYFAAKLSQVLNVDIKQVIIKSVRKGSVIIDFEVATPGDENDAKDMKKAMDKAVPAGQMNFFSGSKVLNYNSEIGERDNGSDEKKSSKVGVIVGTIVGAVCIVAAILIWKKVAMMKAKKALSVQKVHQGIVSYEDSMQKTFKTEV